MFTLASGAVIKFSDAAQEWQVVDGDVVGPPRVALLLLEMEPSAEIFDALPGFPFGEVIERGKRSGLGRYVRGAARWEEAVRARG